jgi:hypothetical protein
MIFKFDGEYISIKQTTLGEFQAVVNSLFQERLANFTMIASDGTNESS